MIWLIGNKGMLGADVEKVLYAKKMAFVSSDTDVDVCDYLKLKQFADNKKVSWIINCSGYTAVDKAEEQQELAYKVNSTGVLNIAKVAMECHIKLIHISTDYVFDGVKSEAYLETDKTNPLSVYGKSKLQGEININNNCNKFFIIRTAWLYGHNGPNFVGTMLKLFKEKDEVRVVGDQYGSPTYTKDLAELITQIICNDFKDYGVYHFTNEGRISWYQFAAKIYELAKKTGLINRCVHVLPVTTDQYPTKAVRPKNSCLSKEKTKKTFTFNIRDWDVALADFLCL